MVAATNSNPVVNNALANALNAAPAKQTSSATSSSNSNAAPDNAPDDNDFTNLLNALLGDDANAKSSTTDGDKAVKPADAKEDQQADAPDAVMPQWLLSPLGSLPVPTVVTNAAPSVDNADDAVDALTPANNAATNALLAQSLKQLSSSTSDSTDATTDNQSGDNFSGLLVNAGQSQAAQGTSILKQDALLTIDDKGKSDAQHVVGTDDKATNAIQSMANFQSVTNYNNATTTTQYMIHSSVGSQQWTTDVGNQLSLMIAHKTQSASLQLTPDNLGPVQVKIDVHNNQASVWFTADHPDTRTALEQSLPQLRELFASQGMSLMDAGVFGQQPQQQAYVPQQPSASFGMTDMSNEVTTTQQVMKIGLLDTYV